MLWLCYVWKKYKNVDNKKKKKKKKKKNIHGRISQLKKYVSILKSRVSNALLSSGLKPSCFMHVVLKQYVVWDKNS